MASREEILRFDDSPPPPGADPWVVPPVQSRIEIADYDPAWPDHARALSEHIRAALGMRALRVEHVGSTSVPGLAAKPVIDLDLTVADPTAEAAWLPQLEAAGFVLTVREPWWHEHRMLRSGRREGAGVVPVSDLPNANVHVFGPDSPELVRHVVFRNWLQANAADRERYAAAKLAAASAGNQRVMEYNARKQAVVREIYDRAFRAAGLTAGD